MGLCMLNYKEMKEKNREKVNDNGRTVSNWEFTSS